MKRICVFCSSNLGSLNEFKLVAEELGQFLAENNLELVYGGANVGLMKATAEAVLNNNGKATGIITHFLAGKHLTQKDLSTLITVDTMQERKAKMAELADAFIVLPGGFGTQEELFEVLTAAQLGFHEKPIAIINTNGFYNYLKLQIQTMVDARMLLPQHAEIAQFVDSVPEAIKALANYEAPNLGKWIDKIRKENGHSV